MPLYFTPEQETEALSRRGFNSNDFYIEPETGAIRRRQKIQPSFDAKTPIEQLGIEGSLEKPKDDRPSVFGAASRGFASELLPSSGAILTGSRAASALMPWAVEAAPASRGLSLAVPPIAGIGTGILTALGIGKAQEAVLPESVKQTLARDIQQQPIASLSGRIAANFPLMRPSISNLGQAAKTTGHLAENLITGGVKGPVNPADISNLVNVGLGGATGVASSIVPRILANQPIDPLEAVLSGAGGSLFSEPTKFLGTKLGLHPTEPRINKLKQASIEQRKPGLTMEERATEELRPSEEDVEAFDVSTKDERPTRFFSEKKADGKDYIIPFKRISKEDKALFPGFFNEKGKLINVDEPTFREMLDKKIHPEEFETFKTNLAEAESIKKESDLRRQIDEARLKSEQDLKTLQNQLEASIAAREKPPTFKTPKPEEVKSGTRALSIPEMGQKQVTTLKQRAYNKEANYQYWKDLWKKSFKENSERLRDEAKKFEEEGFAERYRLEEIEGKPQPKFSEQENLPARIEPKGGTKFSEEGQGLQPTEKLKGTRAWINSEGKFVNVSGYGQHYPTAISMFPELRNVDNISEVMFKKGFAHVTGDTSDKVIEVYRREPLSSAQKRSLINEGIEKNKKVTFNDREVLYDPENRFQEAETQLERLSSVKRLEKQIRKPEEAIPKASLFDYIKKTFGPLRNIDIQEGVVVDKRTNKEAKGVAITQEGVKERIARINPFKATLDTLGHEPFHIFGEDLRNSPNKIDRDTMAKFDKAIQDSPDFKRINEDRVKRGLEPHTVEELGTEEFGIEFARRILNPDKMEGTLKRSWQDFLGRLKVKWGKASVEDFTRLLTNRFFKDSDYFTQFKSGALPNKPTEKQQESEESYGIPNRQKNEHPNNEKNILEESNLSRGELQQKQMEEGTKVFGRREQGHKLSKEEQGLSKEKVTEEISGRLGEASVKAASKTIPSKMDEMSAGAMIDKKYTQLAEDLGAELLNKNPKIKNLDVEFLKDELSSIGNRNRDVEKAWRKRLGDEFIDEIQDRYDKELKPLFEDYDEKVRTSQEAGTKAQKKAEELEAFEREDVERHSEEEQGLDFKNLSQREKDARNIPYSKTLWKKYHDYYDVDNTTIDLKDTILNALDKDKNLSSKVTVPLGKQYPPYAGKEGLVNWFHNYKGELIKLLDGDEAATSKIQSNFGTDFIENLKKLLNKNPEISQAIIIADMNYKERALALAIKEIKPIINEPYDITKAIILNDWRDIRADVYEKNPPLGEWIDKSIHDDLYTNEPIFPENEKFSTEDQGLKNKAEYTPEKILERIKNTRVSPDFKRIGTFKRGIQELAGGRLPIIGSDIDKLELRGGVSGKLLALALREYFAKNRELEGRYLNPSLEAINKLSAEDLDDLYSKMLSEKKTGETQRDNLNEKQQEVYDVLRDTIRLKQEEQIAAGQKIQGINRSGKIFYRLPKIDPYYVPEIVGSKTLDILLNDTGSTAFNNLKKDFISYQRSQINNLSEAEASKMFDELLASYGGPVKGDTTHFGAVRRAEGIGLPESWLESDMATAMRRYWRRVAKDRAFYDTIETDDDLMHIIGRKVNNEGKPLKFNSELNSLGGNETLGNIMDIIQGRFIKTNPRLDAASRIASNAVLGPITGITDSINAAPLLAKFIPSVAHIPGFLKASLSIPEGIKNAFKQGIIRENVTSIGDIVNPSDEFTEKLRNVANLVSKVNTREHLEKFSRGLSQALSTYLVDVHTGLAEAGNQKSIDLLTGLANNKDYTKLSRDELASRLVELTQGTYDPRGLPSWAIDSQIAPFFRLAKWNIEQLNNLYKHVLIPASKGNLTPLLMTLGGGLIGGYLAKEVREKLNLKKQAYPEYKEIAESSRGLKGNIPAIAYNLAAAISYSGITGLLGDVTKAGFDVAFKNTPQGFNYPLVEIIGDGSVKLAQAADAIAEGETPINVVPKLLEDLALKNIQIGRVVYNQIAGRTLNKQKFEDTESRRNLRIYKMTEGLPYQAQGIQSDYENPYKNLDTKKFKQRGIKELPEALKEGQELLKNAAKSSKGNIEEFKKKTSGLKKMPVTTLPSPENDPIGFARFLTYNNRVRGKEDTRQRLKSYFNQKEANRIKANFLP